ncbi:MAG: hypothetical protein PHF60_01565 [Candidatus ainarchaeum sp.]|nr:hypothetical protein [Candidatus ainarchaeum sp.]
MNKTPLLFSILLLSVCSGTTVDANFDNLLSGYYFNTDMSFTSDFTLSTDADYVIDGDANDLQNGDSVCSGAVLNVMPTTSTKWAVSDLSIKSLYPECSVSYCPAMESGGSVSHNKAIKWLSGSVFDEHDDYGDSSGFVYDYSQTFAQEKYGDLGTFYDQPMTYHNLSGDYSNKEGGANVFCKGTLQVRDGSTTKSSLGMPFLLFGGVDFPVNSAGSHAISTRLADVECFGAVVKHPLNTDSHKDFFRLYYFTKNQPSIADSTATKTITINVETAGGTCEMHQTDVVASSSLLSEDIIMLKTTMHNDGDPIKVTSVTWTNPDYSVVPFPTSLCTDLGFPSSLCPTSNGFNEEIYSFLFTSRNLYVLIYRTPGASGGLTLTYHAQTMDDTCGGPFTCTEPLSLSGPITCEIVPSSDNLGSNMGRQFNVSCLGIDGYDIPCVGDDWYWAEGLDGDFIEKDNTHALAYTTSPPGSDGSLRYESGIALCLSQINVTETPYSCEFDPSSAELNFSQSQAFAFNCTDEEDDTPTTPDSSEYDLIDGLDGSTSDESTTGVTYNAPDDETDGNLRGIGWFDEYFTAPALAPINVVNGTGGMNDTNDTNETGYNDDGSSIWCTIGGNGVLTVYPGYSGWVGIQCGPDANETCDSVDWSMEPPEVGALTGSDTNGTYYSITGAPGDSGQIWAIVTPGGDGCYKPFTIMSPFCWEFS